MQSINGCIAIEDLELDIHNITREVQNEFSVDLHSYNKPRREVYTSECTINNLDLNKLHSYISKELLIFIGYETYKGVFLDFSDVISSESGKVGVSIKYNVTEKIGEKSKEDINLENLFKII